MSKRYQRGLHSVGSTSASSMFAPRGVHYVSHASRRIASARKMAAVPLVASFLVMGPVAAPALAQPANLSNAYPSHSITASAASGSYGMHLTPAVATTSFKTAADSDFREAALKAGKSNKLVSTADDEDYLKTGDFYLRQSGSGRCTITSVAMMVRRAAYLDGNDDWESITERSVAATGWTSAGVKFSFSTAGYTVKKISVSGTTASLKALLEEHPEGVAIYDSSLPHAVCLTDYDEETGTFYCGDPAGYYSGKRITLGSSWNGACRGGQSGVVSHITSAWVITNR